MFKRKKLFVYYVVYTIKKNGEIGKGSTNIFRGRKIKTFKDVEQLGEFIEKQNGFEVIIESWTRLKNEYPPNTLNR